MCCQTSFYITDTSACHCQCALAKSLQTQCATTQSILVADAEPLTPCCLDPDDRDTWLQSGCTVDKDVKASSLLKFQSFDMVDHCSFTNSSMPLWPSNPALRQGRNPLDFSSSHSSDGSMDSHATESPRSPTVSHARTDNTSSEDQSDNASADRKDTTFSWLCRYCKAWTSSPRTTCIRCQRPRYTERIVDPNQVVSNILNKDKRHETRWECPHCRHRNPSWSRMCVNCLWKPPEMSDQSPPADEQNGKSEPEGSSHKGSTAQDQTQLSPWSISNVLFYHATPLSSY